MKRSGVSATFLVPLLALAGLATALPPRSVQIPPDLGEATFAAREAAQEATLGAFGVPVDFHFHDGLAASGITFVHRIVDDAGLDYKPVHYDHGNGLAAADVDGDGRVDLYFLTQLGESQLWRNLGGGRFEDVTARAGIGLRDRVTVSASFADVDNDGDPDIYITTVRKGNALFLNDGQGRFTDVTEKAGLTYIGHSSAAVFLDYDRDGWVDLFLVNVGRYTTDRTGRGGYYVGRENAFSAHHNPALSEASILYHNRGDGSFEDASKKVLLVDRSWSGDAAAADLDGDGWTDLYVLDMQGDDHFYQNVRGQFFVDRTAKLFPHTPAGSMGVKAFDWNGDGRLDLLVTDMHSDMNEEVGPEREKLKSRRQIGNVVLRGVENNVLGNAFYQASGDGFREVSDEIGVESYWPWGVSVADVNADGWPDVFITGSMNYPFRYGFDSLLLNDRGKTFRDAEILTGIEPRPGPLSQPWFELDCPPKDVPGRDRRCGDATGRVAVIAARGSRSSAILDLDGDGDLDIVTNEFNGEPRVLLSDLAQRRRIHWLAVHLEGRRSNASALGAEVRVTAGGRTQLQVMDGGSGYLSHSLLPLYFGLGGNDRVDRLEVRWPSGAKQELVPEGIDRLVTVREPAAPVP